MRMATVGQMRFTKLSSVCSAPRTQKTTVACPFAVARPTWTEIVAEFRAANRKRCRRRSFTISTPDSCSLKHDGEDLILREVLQASSIEIPPDRAARR